MSKKELRSALFARYRVTLRRRWYYLLLVIFYTLLGVFTEFDYIRTKDLSGCIVTIAVFFIIGVVSVSVIEITKHERCQYMIPLNYEERKKYYLIGVLSNFTIMLILSIIFIGISLLINKDYGIKTIQFFAVAGLPYIEAVAPQKINMFKGKKKKDNPKMIYITYIYGIAVGIGLAISFSYLHIVLANQLYLMGLILITNVIGMGRLLFCIYQIIEKDTDYENVKVKQLLALKKIM